jgi:hypothetical protein
LKSFAEAFKVVESGRTFQPNSRDSQEPSS